MDGSLNILSAPQYFLTSSQLSGLWLTLANEMIAKVMSLFHQGKKECQKKKECHLWLLQSDVMYLMDL